jgi:phosphate butyryltransferase
MLITNFKEMYDTLGAVKRRRVSVACADSPEALQALSMACDEGLIDAILVGSPDKIREASFEAGVSLSGFEIHPAQSAAEAAEEAVKLVSSGYADIIMKGMITSGDFLKAVLNREHGLRKPNATLSAVAIMQADKLGRFLFITDAGIVPAPDLLAKAELAKNAVSVAKAFGVEMPKVAALCASETVSAKLPATTDAAKLEEMSLRGELGGCVLAGPISLDLAVSVESAREKKYSHPVAGLADILLAPDIEAANILYKSLTHFAGMKTGGAIAGAAAPIIFTSRTDTPETKLNTIAIAAYLAKGVS